MSDGYFILAFFCALTLRACSSHSTIDTNKMSSVSNIGESSTAIIEADQEIIFDNLLSLTKNTIPVNIQKDSMAFIIIPIDAVCNSCRDKAIQNLEKYLTSLPANHIAIITGNGMKIIRSYFADRGKKLPTKEGQIFFDGDNSAYLKDLVFLHPTIYYGYNKKVYEKVKSLPITIEEDLERFFRFK